MEMILSSENFDAEVLKADKKVLVDFWATWCGPCKRQGPILSELAAEGYIIGKVDVDEQPDLAQQFQHPWDILLPCPANLYHIVCPFRPDPQKDFRAFRFPAEHPAAYGLGFFSVCCGDSGVDGLHDRTCFQAVHHAGLLQAFHPAGRAAQAVHTDRQQHLNGFGVIHNDLADQGFLSDFHVYGLLSGCGAQPRD